MPYCSLEEAWGSDFHETNTKPKKFSKITPNESENDDYYSLNEEPFYKKEKPKRKRFSRSYNRLDKHSGPKTRLPDTQQPYMIDDMESVEDQTKPPKEHFSSNETYLNVLIVENKKLKDMIQKYKHNNNDGVFDLVLFLASGVFVIFLLDTVTKGIRRF